MSELVSLNRLIVLDEAELCGQLNCRKETLRTHLCNYQFSNVVKRTYWYYKNPQDKRKHKTIEYKITIRDLRLLKSMIKVKK